jgi:hypothetical protein
MDSDKPLRRKHPSRVRTTRMEPDGPRQGDRSLPSDHQRGLARRLPQPQDSAPNSRGFSALPAHPRRPNEGSEVNLSSLLLDSGFTTLDPSDSDRYGNHTTVPDETDDSPRISQDRYSLQMAGLVAEMRLDRLASETRQGRGVVRGDRNAPTSSATS